MCFTYANYCSDMSGSVQWSKFNQKMSEMMIEKKKYPVQIEHLICICTCEVTRSKLADRSITVGWFHFVEVGNSRFSSMSTKTWNSSRTKMIYCLPSFSLEQDYTVLAHRSCSEKQHNTKKKNQFSLFKRDRLLCVVNSMRFTMF